MPEDIELLSIEEACELAASISGKLIKPTNISYLIQYARIKKYNENGNTKVSKTEIQQYFKKQKQQESSWKKKLGDDLNWNLSFSWLREKDTTKHVHRLHPYKGKFIPQLADYFLNGHINEFKKEVYFKPGDIVVDPFCGSGTTLVQSNELGLHAIGIDISAFNTLITNVKIRQLDVYDLCNEINKITKALRSFIYGQNYISFENELSKRLTLFNKKYFPSPEFRLKVRNGVINPAVFGREKEEEFNKQFYQLVNSYGVELEIPHPKTFLDKWYLPTVRKEITFLLEKVNNVQNELTRDILKIILSRSVRSSRATTHYDLATLINPISTPYYCKKHGKICKPLFSLADKWSRYAKDTLKRFYEFNQIRTETHQICLTGDARTISIFKELETADPNFAELAKTKKISGVFSSPPYVGLIDYHEQHAYAYELFELPRRDQEEIGPLSKGKSKVAQDSYVEGIAAVLNNCKNYFSDNYHVFLVANDQYNLYPSIAELSGMKIIDQFKRPVLNRTEGDKGAYAETIFHLQGV